MKQILDQERESPAPAVTADPPAADQLIEAVYQDGVFKPLRPLNLPAGTPIQLRLPRSLVKSAEGSAAGDHANFTSAQTEAGNGRAHLAHSAAGRPLNRSKFPLWPVVLGLTVLSVLMFVVLRPKSQPAEGSAASEAGAEEVAKYAPPDISLAPLAEGTPLVNPELVSEFRLPSLPDGQSAVPRSIAVDSQGNIYVGSAADGLIRKYDRSGKMLLSWGTQEAANAVFSDLADIVIGKNDTVLALEAEGGKIYFFDSQGKPSPRVLPIQAANGSCASAVS